MPFIGNINPTIPTGADPISQGDDEFRRLKQILVDSFPGLDTVPWQKADATRNNECATWGQVRDIFPVGAVMFTATNINPTSFLRGTWTLIAQGRFIVGVGTGSDVRENRTYNEGNDSVGEYRHALTSAENGPHTHSYETLEAGIFNFDGTPTAKFSGNTENRNTSQSGSGSPHENSPPAFGLYCWQRTA